MIHVKDQEFVANRSAAQRGRKETGMVARQAGRHHGVQRSVGLDDVSGER